ncbi:MAG: PPOX class F420-dependent oxidoreductase [Candidatus Dormiibacterota bacterium]|jgi:PPOX class probable F420-dependent enzyme
MSVVPESHADLLERPLFAHLATVRPDGAPQSNPMWFLWDPDAGVIKLTHTKVRSNYRALQTEPRVALSIIDPESGYRYLQVRGNVEKIEDDPTGAFYQTLQQRYLGKSEPVADKDVRVVLTIRPTAARAQ